MAFGLVGFLGGYMLAVQSSWGRLTGECLNPSACPTVQMAKLTCTTLPLVRYRAPPQ